VSISKSPDPPSLLPVYFLHSPLRQSQFWRPRQILQNHLELNLQPVLRLGAGEEPFSLGSRRLRSRLRFKEVRRVTRKLYAASLFGAFFHDAGNDRSHLYS